MRLLLVCLLVCTCSVSERAAEVSYPVAIQVPGGLGVLDGALESTSTGTPVSGSEGAQTFCWDRHGRGFFLTSGGTMSWIARDGGTPRVLVDGFRAVRFPDVSEDGVIAFGATREDGAGEGWEIWFVDEDGSNLRRITAGYDPSWSDDGLYFENYEPTAGLYHYDPDTEEVRPILEPGSGSYTVECSPSGKYLAFSRRGALMLYTIAADSLRPLTDGATYDRFASFSPDERFLVFYRQRESRNWLVHYEIATGAEREISVVEQVTPAYAPPDRF